MEQYQAIFTDKKNTVIHRSKIFAYSEQEAWEYARRECIALNEIENTEYSFSIQLI